MSERYQNICANYAGVDARPGSSIDRAAADAIDLANRICGVVTLNFNGQRVNCDVWDKPADVSQRYFDLVRK